METKDKITYEGSVKIQLLKGKKVVKTLTKHNAGTLQLFSFISKCLAGYLDGMDNYYPRYVRLYNTDTSQVPISFSGETTTSAVPVVGISLDTTDSSEPEALVKYEFIIPVSSIKSGTTSNVIAIYNTINRAAREKPSAYVILTGNQIIDPSDGYNVRVVWTMRISNR